MEQKDVSNIRCLAPYLLVETLKLHSRRGHPASTPKLRMILDNCTTLAPIRDYLDKVDERQFINWLLEKERARIIPLLCHALFEQCGINTLSVESIIATFQEFFSVRICCASLSDEPNEEILVAPKDDGGFLITWKR